MLGFTAVPQQAPAPTPVQIHEREKAASGAKTNAQRHHDGDERRTSTHQHLSIQIVHFHEADVPQPAQLAHQLRTIPKAQSHVLSTFAATKQTASSVSGGARLHFANGRIAAFGEALMLLLVPG